MYYNNTAYKIGKEYISPILFSYVKWVLDNAVNRNIKRLYFMARDGYLMYKAALILCNSNLDYYNLECRYFYCSRISLRLPSYSIIPFKDVIESLFVKGKNVTIDKIFDRIDLSDKQKKEIIDELKIKNTNSNLLENEIESYKNIFLNSDLIKGYIANKAKLSYKNTIMYLKQEGMFDNIKFAIVDSGWLGTIQKTLSILLISNGFNKCLIGFYFGMYKHIDSSDKIEYIPYFFDGNKNILRKSKFNNDIFEMLFSENAGMTKGYKVKNNISVPVFGSYNYCYEKNEVQKIALENISIKSKKEIEKIVFKFMVFPKAEEADYIGKMKFSDDLSDNNLTEFALPLSYKQCKNLLFFKRLILLKNRNKYKELMLFWFEGSIVRSNIHFKKFFIINVFLFNIFRFTIDKLKQ